jgi:hypothetical protein
MSELIWLALICAITYTIKPMLPDYLDLTRDRRSRIDGLRDMLADQHQTVFAVVNANEQLQRRIEKLEKLEETVEHNCLRLATLEGQMWKAVTAAPANEVRHD